MPWKPSLPRLILASLLLLALCLSPSPVEARFRPNREAIAQGVAELLEARSIPSAVVGIYDREGLIWADAYGFADRGRRIRATIETPYQIGSITKLFTATLVLQLRDEGRLRLDDELGTWLRPEPSGAGSVSAISAITLRDLLTHSAGLPPNPVNRIDANGVMQPYDLDDLFEGLRATPLATPRGTRAAYSNLGYAILGHVIERASGARYEDALRQRLLEPLGITATSVGLTPEREAALARHYWFQDPDRQPRDRWVFGELAAFGGLTSTVPDLARFLSSAMRRDVRAPLAPETLSEMQRTHIDWLPALDLGLGWQIWHSRGLGDVLTHGGEVDGHGSYAAFSPALGVGVVLLTNLGGPTASDLGDWLLTQVIEDARRQLTATAEQAAQFSAAESWADAAWGWSSVAAAEPANGSAFYQLGVAELNLDRFDAALAALARARTLNFNPAGTSFTAARAHAAKGDSAMAVRHLQDAVGSGFRGLAALENYPEFRSLRGDPAWPGIIARARRN